MNLLIDRQSWVRSGVAPCLAAMLFLLAARGSHAGELLLQVKTGPAPDDLIEGEAHLPGYHGWIEAFAIGTSGLRLHPRGSASWNEFTFCKPIDRSTPLLLGALADESKLLRVSIRDPRSSTGSHLRLVLHDARITKYELKAEPGHSPFEKFTMSYLNIEWIFGPGGGLPPVCTFAFDPFFGTHDSESDSDGDGLSNFNDPDDDNDCMDDQYEIANGLHPLIPDGQFDQDFDGRTNYEEWLAGTAANDGSSFFAVHSLNLETASGRVTLTVPVTADRSYRIVASPDLSPDSWFLVAEFSVPAGSPPELREVLLRQDFGNRFDRYFFAAEVGKSLP